MSDPWHRLDAIVSEITKRPTALSTGTDVRLFEEDGATGLAGLDLDSLAYFEIVLTIEEIFGVAFEEDLDFEAFETMSALLAAVGLELPPPPPAATNED